MKKIEVSRHQDEKFEELYIHLVTEGRRGLSFRYQRSLDGFLYGRWYAGQAIVCSHREATLLASLLRAFGDELPHPITLIQHLIRKGYTLVDNVDPVLCVHELY